MYAQKQENIAFLRLFICLLIPQVLEEIGDNGIKIYTFPECDSEDDEEFVQINQDLKVCNMCINDDAWQWFQRYFGWPIALACNTNAISRASTIDKLSEAP